MFVSLFQPLKTHVDWINKESWDGKLHKSGKPFLWRSYWIKDVVQRVNWGVFNLSTDTSQLVGTHKTRHILSVYHISYKLGKQRRRFVLLLDVKLKPDRLCCIISLIASLCNSSELHQVKPKNKGDSDGVCVCQSPQPGQLLAQLEDDDAALLSCLIASVSLTYFPHHLPLGRLTQPPSLQLLRASSLL